MRRFPILAIALCLSFGAAAQSAPAECEGRSWQSEHVLGGPLCLPDEIERVVVLDPFYNLAMGLDLDLPIVGAAIGGIATTADPLAQHPGIEDIGSAGEPDLETITRLAPDLILGDAYQQGQNLELLSKIAPTALISTANWKTYLKTIASLADRTERARQRLNAYEERARQIAERMPELTLSFVRIMPGGFQVYVDGPAAYAPFAVLADAGVERPPYETVSDDTVLKRPDWEGLIELKGDVLFYMVGGGHDGGGAALEEETVSNPLWQMLPAVRSDRAYRVHAEHWLGFGGVDSAHNVLDDVERYLLSSEP